VRVRDAGRGHRRSAGAECASHSGIPQPAGAPRLSIVVLPFANLSNDPEQ